MKDKNCIFCKIISGEIPCYKIYEDENCLAFLDICGDVEGHTLVVPKEHCVNALDCEEKLFYNVMGVAQKIAKHYVEICGYSGANFAINCGKSAGQEVEHLHVHVIPRKNTDNFSIYANLGPKERDLESLQEKLKLKG